MRSLPRRFLPGLLATCALGLLVAGACNNTDEAILRALGEGCLVDSDCNDELVCVFRRCHAECESSVDCPAESRCSIGEAPRNVCLLDIECVLHADCAAGKLCGPDLECRDECITDRDCVAEQVCVERLCADENELVDGLLPRAEGSSGEGQACAIHSNCAAPLLCLGGRCLLQCETPDDCPLGASCIDNACDTVHTAPPCVPGQQQDCSSHSECEAGDCVYVCGEDLMWGDCVPAMGGGGGGMGGAGGAGGSVVCNTFLPVNAAIGIEPDAEISLTCPAAVDAASVNANNFTVEVDGVLSTTHASSVTGDTITLTSPTFRPFDATVTVNFDSSITVGGTPIVGGSWQHTVRPGAWGPDTVVDALNAATNSDPAVSVGNDGGGFVAYTTPIQAFAISLSAPAVTPVGTPGTALQSPRVGYHNDGTAVMAFEDSGEIYAAIYDGATWSAKVRVDDPAQTASAGTPELAVDKSGNAMLTWVQVDNTTTRSHVMIAQFPVANNWTAPVIADGLTSTNAVAVDIAADGVDSFTLAYHDDGDSVYARQFVGGTPGTEQTVHVGVVDDTTASVTIGADLVTGDAALAFAISPVDAQAPFASRRIGGAWSSEDDLSAGLSMNADMLDIAIHENGTTVLTFRIGDQIYATSYDPVGMSWAAMAQLLVAVGGDAPHAQLDPSGDALVTWTQPNEICTLTVPNADFTQGGQSFCFTSAGAVAADLAIDDLGRVALAWQTGGVIRTGRFR